MKVMFAGSFNPPTLGHIDLVKTAARMFDGVVVCVMPNAEKKYSLSAEVRLQMLQKCFKGIDNVTAVIGSGLTADFAAKCGCGALIRGIRNTLDFEYEMQMLLECAKGYSLVEVPIQTIYDSKENHQTHFNSVKDSIRIYKILAKRFVKYVFASVSSFIIDILLFQLFVFILKDSFPALYVTLATVSARIISAVYNYLINYKFVFKSHASRGASLAKYALLAVIQMSLSAGIVSLIMHFFPGILETPVKIVVDMILFVLSYTVQQRFVFSNKSKK